MKLKKVAIIGMGLIGGSIGKALLEKNLAGEVVGVCRRQSSLDRAVNEKSLTKGYVNSYTEALKGAEVVFIATPVDTIKKTLELAAGAIKDNKVIVTDVGSTKKEIVDYAKKFKDSFSFVGSHPLAGSEKRGVEHSSSALFEGSLCVLTSDGSTNPHSLKSVQNLWEALGAQVDVITPEAHDRALAFTSHLPHVVAYALAGSEEEKYARYASTGFKDTTRIASSDPTLWVDILMSNRGNVLESIKRFKGILSLIEDDIAGGRAEDLREKLTEYKKIRDEIV